MVSLFADAPQATRRIAPWLIGSLLALGGCVDDAGRSSRATTAESCMLCHNGSQHDDYAGPGIEDPHPFPGDRKSVV